MPVKIHGNDYFTVAERVEKFRSNKANEGYAILTELISNDGEYVIFKARILNVSQNPVATGYAQEKYGSNTINQTSALEVAETSAIGRALACFGLAGSEFASADEVATAISQQNQGVSYNPGDVTEKQKNWLDKLAKESGFKTRDLMANHYINRSVKTKKDATDLIDVLKKEEIIPESF